MASVNTEYGYLALADISRYNAYVAGTEFDHAQEIVGDLLGFLVDRLRPLLTLVQIEGDAVFAYFPEKSISRGETLFELIEKLNRASMTITACWDMHPYSFEKESGRNR